MVEAGIRGVGRGSQRSLPGRVQQHRVLRLTHAGAVWEVVRVRVQCGRVGVGHRQQVKVMGQRRQLSWL